MARFRDCPVTARQRLLADAAHELRTPLATLDAYLEGLADGVRSPSQETWSLVPKSVKLVNPVPWPGVGGLPFSPDRP